jgi:hypothetical protein
VEVELEVEGDGMGTSPKKDEARGWQVPLLEPRSGQTGWAALVLCCLQCPTRPQAHAGVGLGRALLTSQARLRRVGTADWFNLLFIPSCVQIRYMQVSEGKRLAKRAPANTVSSSCWGSLRPL